MLKLDEDTLLAVFEGVPHFDISRDELAAGIKAVDLCTEKAAIFPSKGEMRKLVQSGGVSFNKEKLAEVDTLTIGKILFLPLHDDKVFIRFKEVRKIFSYYFTDTNFTRKKIIKKSKRT